MTTCPTGHDNPGHYRYCGQCGVPLTPQSSSTLKPEPQGQWRPGVPPLPVDAEPRGWRARPFGVQIGAIAGVLVVIVGLVLAISLMKGSGSEGRTDTAGSSVEEPAAESFSRDDLLQEVCKSGTWRNGNGNLPNADGQGSCVAVQGNGAINIGQYSSTFEAQNDGKAMQGMPWAIGTDAEGGTWLVIYLGTRSSAPLEPLLQYGFAIQPAESR